MGSIHERERERGAAAGDSMAPAQQPAEDLEKEKRPGGSPGGLGEEAREPAYCIRCGVGFLVAILLDIDRETHEYSLIRRGCVRRRSPLLSLYSFYARAHRCAHMHERSRTQVGNTRRDTRVHRGSVLRARVCSPQEEKYIYIYVQCRPFAKGRPCSLLEVSPPPVFSPRGRRLS